MGAIGFGPTFWSGDGRVVGVDSVPDLVGGGRVLVVRVGAGVAESLGGRVGRSVMEPVSDRFDCAGTI